MVSQVQVVCILQIVNGVLVSLMGLLLAAMGPVMFAVVSADKKGQLNREDEVMLTIFPIVYLVMGIPALIAGVLNIIAAIRAMRFQGRTFWLVALIANAVAVLTCYCTPTSIGVMVYGLVVYFNADVVKAFELGAQGVPAEEIRQRFSGSRPRRRISYEEEENE